jgi:RHS repeat-associated protein
MSTREAQKTNEDKNAIDGNQKTRFELPSISLPKGGGAIRDIGEKFSVNPVTGTGSLTIPIYTSSGRSGFGPQISLSYNSGAGNGAFGLGWNLSIPSITRKTDKGLPLYQDKIESDVFILSGSEDLVPILDEVNGKWQRNPTLHSINGVDYLVQCYRPRIEGLFARIERWTNSKTAEIHWRSISKNNITTIYGETPESRILDPADPLRIFSWLICESYDDTGNAIRYEYKGENSQNIDFSVVHERNRTEKTRSANHYLKRIKYGNKTPRQPNEDLTAHPDSYWMFEVVFDYGEHYSEDDNGQPTFVSIDDKNQEWPIRLDPFSSYVAGFEVRTYRLCRHVLMFHHFPDELGTPDYLVRSTSFTYAESPNASFITAITQSGYVLKNGGKYLKKSLPPLEFGYSQAKINNEVHEIDPDSLQNLPYGLDGTYYRWVDMDGEGLSGILTQQAGSWFYKRNLGSLPVTKNKGEQSTEPHFGPLEKVSSIPSLADIQSGKQQFLDLDGDGQIELVHFENSQSGFFERTQDENWESFIPFSSVPNISWNDPNLRFIDLTGDGHADVLITEDQAFTWYPSIAEKGFGPHETIRKQFDEEKGPSLIFANSTQSVYLADMSGDGLTDLVRILNGEVCYWPNLGYGRFGTKITMDKSPLFDTFDQFDNRRIRLADTDGSGTTDIIYLGTKGVQLYFNQSGNSWSNGQRLSEYPHTDNLSSVMALDLLGNGTACLLWSSLLPGDARHSMRYIDLMGGIKPHLLISVKNNMGSETGLQYAASTKFYLMDKYAGEPWITKLPFPVQVVEQVETYDLISRNRFVTQYAYHHGYFDGIEREFHGFGMVEQWDTEAFEDYVVGVKHLGAKHELAPELYQPPVTTRTWFHTGAFFGLDRILHQLRDEYYQKKQHISEPALPTGLDAQELRECLRALKGLTLRQEIYSFDGSPQEKHPYRVVENNYKIKLLQPRGENKHAAFFPVGCESVSLIFERNPSESRISHSLNLEVDEYGNVLKGCSVVYGRKNADPLLPLEVTTDQSKLYVVYDEVDYTHDIDQESPTAAYRLRVPYESRRYEITGVRPASGLFQLEEIKDKIEGCADITYEANADGVTPQKRLLSYRRTLFLDNNFNHLSLGQWDTLGLAYESYRLAFTPGMISGSYSGKVADADFGAAGYVHFNGDANWWIPSGTTIYPANPADHFYIPIGTKDPLGIEKVETFDKYDLLVEQVQVKQASWSEVIAINDYRILGPVMVTDPNKNRSAAEMDELGMVIKSAIMGKDGAADGDKLDDPTVRMEYELFNWMNNHKPNYIHVFAREQHGSANHRWQESYVYSNGSGSVAMVKAQAHPGKALQVNPDGTMTYVDANPRWVGNGRTILNNKSNPVKQYGPYFSTTHEYEDEKALREIGVTPILYYDAIGRNIRTVFPNGAIARVEFNPWMQKAFDANDTVKEGQWYADRGSPNPTSEHEPLNDPERRAAWLAAKHADTPSTLHFDSLGRTIYTMLDYGSGKTAAVRWESDLTGRFSKTFDQKNRQVVSGFVGMVGAPIYGENAEKGRRWAFQNILGALVKAWDEHGRQFRIEYDLLHRPVSTFVQESGQVEILFNYVVYGDRHPNAQQLNLLGTTHEIFDQAGMVRVPEVDFKGNPKNVEQVLTKDYKNSINWNALTGQPDYVSMQAAAASALENEVFNASSVYDALNRPMRVVLPDGTVLVPTYNETNFLSSLQAQIRGQGAFVDFLKDQDYDAKGQRQFVHYGNELYTRYFYDPYTFRLINLLTYKSGDDPNVHALQNLHYTYDPVGNTTYTRDDAQQTIFFNNAVVLPESLFEYDATYQLIMATGREHAGLINDAILSQSDLEFVPQLPHPNNITAVRTYTEQYEYDLLGNIKILRHRFKTQSGVGNGWMRRYRYAYEDDPVNPTNRLIATSLPGDPDSGPYSATYGYDVYGNMTHMPHLPKLDWNFMDQLRRVDLGGGGTAYYVYGIDGQRIRKVIERLGSVRTERIYLGAVEIYRQQQGSNPLTLERYTLHISDNIGRVAQVDIKTKDDNNSDPANLLNVPLIRYQYSNHLGSTMLETNADGDVISYEEYHPFGTSAYRSAKPGFDLSLKRYRFSSKERDDETELYYFGKRYYATWLGRWTSSDPAGFVDGLNTYKYCKNNPIRFVDKFGNNSDPPSPLGEVSWEIPAKLFLDTRTGKRFDDATVLHNVSGWLSSTHSDRRYTPGTLEISRWVSRVTNKGTSYQAPVINAEWLDNNGQRLLPARGEFGSVEPMRRQPRAEYTDPGDKSTRLTENEHATPRAQNAAIDPNYGDSEYRGDATVRTPRGVSLDKTRKDNASSSAIQERVASEQPVNVTEDIDMSSNANFQRANDAAKAAGQPSIRNPGSINRGTQEQIAGRFERGKGSSIPQGSSIEEPVIEEFNPSPPPSLSSTIGNYGSALGTGLARMLIPGFVEAEIIAVYAHPFVVGTLGITSGSLPAIAEAISAAPTQFAASVTLPALGGAIVGNAIESAVVSQGGSKEAGIAAAVIGAAATGAVIGTFIPIPGVATLAGAAIGATLGVIGYGISKLF